MSDTTQTGVLIPYLTEMFRFQAWMAMGKVASPISGKVERDLPVAKQMIDLLGELEARTEGNRSAEESKMLAGVLTELRLNYMDEAKKPAEEVEKDADPDAMAAAGEDGDDSSEPMTNGQDKEPVAEESEPS